jgi:hypothetical protein
MIKRVIYLISEPFTKTYYNRYGIGTLLENGFSVEVWDLERLVNKDAGKGGYKPQDIMEWEHVTVLKDKREALRRIRELKADTFIIPLMGYCIKSYDIYKAISDSDSSYAVLMTDTVPFPVKQRKQYLGYYLKKIRSMTVKKIVNGSYIISTLFRRLNFLWPKIKPPRYMIAGGERSGGFFPKAGKNTEIIWTHNMDYDVYLEEIKTPRTELKIAVFIDEFYPFHPDFAYIGIKPPVKADTYYPQLCRFFRRVEKELGLKVVIAAHPRSDYEKRPDCFEGRECIRGKTMELVRESRAVLAHNSTALDYAIMFNKPVIFLSSAELEKSYLGLYIKNTAECFGKKPIFMDECDNIELKEEVAVSKDHYNRYRQAYIKTDNSEEIPAWQIVANKLKKNHLKKQKT